MSELRQRVEPIRSKAIREAARDQRCTLNLPHICNYDPATVVLAHIHDEQFGKAEKADDTSAMFACFACHSAYDEHRTGLDALTLLQLVFRAYQRTIRRLVLMKVLGLKQDTPKTFSERPAKPRKPPAERSPVPKGRPMPGTIASGQRKRMNGQAEQRSDDEEIRG